MPTKPPTPKRRGRPVGKNPTVRMLTKVPRATFTRLEREAAAKGVSRDAVVIAALVAALDGTRAGRS